MPSCGLTMVHGTAMQTHRRSQAKDTAPTYTYTFTRFTVAVAADIVLLGVDRPGCWSTTMQ